MTTLNDIKTKYCIDEDVVKFMGHSIPKRLWNALSNLNEEIIDQRQTGFFGSPEMKQKYINRTNSLIRYVEQNIKTADPKEQGYIEKQLNQHKADRDKQVSKLMVLKGRGKK